MNTKTIIQEGEINVIVEVNNGVINVASRKLIPDRLNTLPSIILDEVIGRENDLQQIKALLDSDDRVMLVSGIGGIGKTTVAKAFLQQFLPQYKHIAWIEVTSSVKEAFVFNSQLCDSLDLSSRELDLNPGTSDAVDRGFELIVNRMRQLSGNNLLIIDNAQEDVEHLQVLDHLSLKPFWKVLVTSRYKLEGFVEYELDVLKPEAARRLFYLHYKQEFDDGIIQEILEAIGYHTLAIEVVAKTAQARRLKLSEVSDRLKKKGLDISEEANIKIRHSYNQRIPKVFEYLLKTFDLASLTDFDEWVLTQFSVMPPVYIPYQDNDGENILFLLAKTKDSERDQLTDALNDLVSKGWLNWDKTTDSFKVHQVIQEVLAFKLHPNFQKCSNLMTYIYGRVGMLGFVEGHRFIKYVESLVSNADLDLEVDRAFQPHLQATLLMFGDTLQQHFRGELANRCFAIATSVSSKLESTDERFVIRKAESLHIQANSLLDGLDPLQAATLLLEALSLYQRGLEFSREYQGKPNVLSGGETSEQIQDSIEYVTYGNDIKRMQDRIGSVYCSLGRAHHMLSKYQDADSAFITSLNMLREPSHDRALALLYYARLLNDQKKYADAESLNKECVDVAETLAQSEFTKYGALLFHAYNEYGQFVNQFARREKEILELYSKALGTGQKLMRFNPDLIGTDFAGLLINLSVFHLERIDHLENARAYALEARLVLQQGMKTDLSISLLEKIRGILDYITQEELKRGIQTIIGDNEVLIRKAANEGTTELVQTLVRLGTELNSVDRHGWTPLMYAVKKRHYDIVSFLLDNGADCNVRNPENETVLIFATMRNDMEMVKRILKYGPDLSAVSNEGRFPLALAIANDSYDMTKLLLDAGANPNQQNARGHNPLLLAIDMGNTAIIRLLAGCGAALNSKFPDGLCPLLLSLRYVRCDVVKTLLDLGATVNKTPDSLAILSSLYQAHRQQGNTELADIIEKLL